MYLLFASALCKVRVATKGEPRKVSALLVSALLSDPLFIPATLEFITRQRDSPAISGWGVIDIKFVIERSARRLPAGWADGPEARAP